MRMLPLHDPFGAAARNARSPDDPASARRRIVAGVDLADATRETKLRALVRMECHRFPDRTLSIVHLHAGRLIEAVDREDSAHLPPSGIWIRRVGSEQTVGETRAALKEARRMRDAPDTADELLVQREILGVILGTPLLSMDTPTADRAYADALWLRLKVHVDSLQALDCASNTAFELLQEQVDDDQAYERLSARLRWQRDHFGLVADDDQIEAAARSGASLKR